MDILFFKHKKFKFISGTIDISELNFDDLLKIQDNIIKENFYYRYHFGKNTKMTLESFKSLVMRDNRLSKNKILLSESFSEIKDIIDEEVGK